MKPNYKPLIYWVTERESIRVNKEDRRLPQRQWTKDPILRDYRFCNVRREDDRVTRWINDNIREPFADHPYLWLMLCIARQINWPPSLKELIEEEAWPSYELFRPQHIAEVLNNRKKRGEKVYTGAYIIAAPHEKNADKQEYMAHVVIGEQWKRRKLFGKIFAGRPTLEEVHSELMVVNGWGKFMTYQAVVDMRFTPLLDRAKDRGTWAAAGPGTIRGLNRIHSRPVGVPLTQKQALCEMQEINGFILSETGVPMDFSDIPNILCETDKYLRVKNDEGRPRSYYQPSPEFEDVR